MYFIGHLAITLAGCVSQVGHFFTKLMLKNGLSTTALSNAASLQNTNIQPLAMSARFKLETSYFVHAYLGFQTRYCHADSDNKLPINWLVSPHTKLGTVAVLCSRVKGE